MRKILLPLFLVLWASFAFPHHRERPHTRMHAQAMLHKYFPNPSTFLVMDSVRQEARVDKAQHDQLALAQTLFSGKGVIVGIVDVGFDLSHPAFFTPEGSYRVKRLWLQSQLAGTPPSAFSYGAEYTSEEAILALEHDSSNLSHGTHVANIAAGSKTGSAYYGVAYDSELILVSTSLKNSEVLDGVKYIAAYAREAGKPCVINLSIGGRVGPHDGTSAFDRGIDSLVSRGVLVVGAMGNDGSSNHHASTFFTSTADTLKLANPSSEGKCYADIWGEAGTNFRISATLSDRRSGEVLFRHEAWSEAATDTAFIDSVSWGGEAVAAILTGRDPVNNRPHAAVICSIPGKGNRLRFDTRIVAAPGTEVHAWAGEGSEFQALEGHSVKTSHTVMEVGGTGRNTISVGAYVTKNRTPYRDTDYSLYDLFPRSSRGPTLDGRTKPDITASGSLVVSAVSRFDPTFRPISIDTVRWRGTEYYYAANQGTSMASPVVTGIVALWLQANPELSAGEIRDVLTQTAWQDARVDMSDPYSWGRGKVDAYEGLKYILTHYPLAVEIPGTEQPKVELIGTGREARLLFLQREQNIQIQGYSLSGEALFSAAHSSIEAGQEVEIPETPHAGILLIKVTTDRGRYTYKLVQAR